MKQSTLPLSLLIGAALTIPSLAMAAPATNTATTATATTAPADMQTATADPAMQTEAANANSEMGANQSNPFVINETQRISRASVNSVNNNTNPQTMPTDLQTQQQDMQQPRNMQQQNMHDAADALLQEQDSQEVMLQEEEVAD